MKKALVFLLLLACVGMVAFADGAPTAGTFSSWDRGTFYPYFQAGSASAVAGWGPAWTVSQGIYQQWTFSYDSKPDKYGDSYGFSATDQFGGTQNWTANSSGNWMDTYFNVANVVKLELGNTRVYDYSISALAEPYGGTGTSNTNLIECNTDYLAWLTIMPVSAVKILAGLYAGGAPEANAIYATPGVKTNFANNFLVGLQYAVPKMATINLWYKAEEQGAAFLTDSTGFANMVQVFNVNATYTGIQNVTIQAGYAGNFANSSDPVHNVTLGAQTTQGPLTAALDVNIVADTGVTAFAAVVSGEYAIQGPFGVGAILGYDSGQGTNWFEGGAGVYAGVYINPYVAVNFDNGSRVRIGVLYASGVSSPTLDPAGQVLPNQVSESQAVVAIPIDYVWSF